MNKFIKTFDNYASEAIYSDLKSNENQKSPIIKVERNNNTIIYTFTNRKIIVSFDELRNNMYNQLNENIDDWKEEIVDFILKRVRLPNMLEIKLKDFIRKVLLNKKIQIATCNLLSKIIFDYNPVESLYVDETRNHQIMKYEIADTLNISNYKIEIMNIANMVYSNLPSALKPFISEPKFDVQSFFKLIKESRLYTMYIDSLISRTGNVIYPNKFKETFGRIAYPKCIKIKDFKKWQ
jgi:hypothetical protein